MDQGCGYDDLVVPKDQSLSDGFQPSESWLNWGLNTHNSFEFTHKYLVSDANQTPEQLRFDSQTSCDQLETESKGQSSCTSFGERSVWDNSLQNTSSAVSGHGADNQLNSIARIEHMDDHFLTCLIDDLQEMDDNQNSPCFSSESQDRMMPAAEFWNEAAVDSDSVSSNGFTKGSSCTRSYPQSMDHETSRVLTSPFNQSNLEKAGLQKLKVPSFVSSVPSEDDCMNGQVQEEPLCEESALHELETVMTQLPIKTRICIRDALYRLAKNSRPLGVAYEEADSDFPWCEGSGMEPDTNQIDRAIASMMFNKLELDVMDYHISTPDNSGQDFVPSHPHCCYSNVLDNPMFPGDAEVPVASRRVEN